jgi:DNA-binding LacI/PurR family transcriptional regulator
LSTLRRILHNLLILFCRPDGSYLRAIREQRIDGIFVLQSTPGTHYIGQILQLSFPTVILNKAYALKPSQNAACVRADHERAMRTAMRELVECGCHDILAIHDYQIWDANAQLHKAFNTELRRLAPQGITGTTLIPRYPGRHTHFPDPSGVRAQLLEILKSGRRLNGVFVNGDTTAEDPLGTVPIAKASIFTSKKL